MSVHVVVHYVYAYQQVMQTQRRLNDWMIEWLILSTIQERIVDFKISQKSTFLLDWADHNCLLFTAFYMISYNHGVERTKNVRSELEVISLSFILRVPRPFLVQIQASSVSNRCAAEVHCSATVCEVGYCTLLWSYLESPFLSVFRINMFIAHCARFCNVEHSNK